MDSPTKVIFDLHIKPRAAGYDHGKDLLLGWQKTLSTSASIYLALFR